MAIEYEFEVTPVLDAAAMLDYFADLLNCGERFENTGVPARAARNEFLMTAMDTPSAEDPEEEPLLGDLFGVRQTTSISFRMNKFLTREENRSIFRDMVAACAKFLEDHPGADGIFSFQSEDIYLQRLGDDGIVLSEDLRKPGYNDGNVFADLLSRYPTRELGRVEDHLSS
jgi:hypothetical protein